jgi:hypothetical protein
MFFKEVGGGTFGNESVALVTDVTPAFKILLIFTAALIILLGLFPFTYYGMVALLNQTILSFTCRLAMSSN